MKKLAIALGVSAALGMGAVAAADQKTLIVDGSIQALCKLDVIEGFSFDLASPADQKVAEVGLWCNDGRPNTNVVYNLGEQGAGTNGFRLNGAPGATVIAYKARLAVPGPSGGQSLFPPTGGDRNVDQPAGSGAGMPLNYTYSDLFFEPQVNGSESAGDYQTTVTITVSP